MADLEVTVEYKVPLVITSLGAVADVVKAIQSYGGKVFHDVATLRHAKKAAEAGVDGLILVCGGAGGHAGITNPFALMNEVRQFFKGTIILAGGLSNGQDVAAALMMGADFAYMGTRFINTTEAMAEEEYKQMIIDSTSADIVHTPAVSGIPANFMVKSLQDNGVDPKSLPDHKVDMGAEARAWKTIWSAGHGVGAIHDVLPTATLIERLTDEFSSARSEFDTKHG